MYQSFYFLFGKLSTICGQLNTYMLSFPYDKALN